MTTSSLTKKKPEKNTLLLKLHSDNIIDFW